VANDNLKKPESDSKVPLTEEAKDKRNKIIILVVLIIIVLAILIGTAYYFSSRDKEEDKPIKNNPGNIVKPDIKDNDKDPEPVVNNNNNNNNNVIVYRPVQRPVTPSEPVKPTTITGSEDDASISVEFDEETKTINISGVSKYVAKVNDNFGDGFNNIVQVKIALNTKYKYADLEKMNFIVTTEVNNGKKNYFLDSVQEDENGNLYFYWLQAVGKGLDLTPQLTINYGDGNIEVYTMDLSNISIQTPLENGEDLAQVLVTTESNKVMVGGVELNLDYKLTILEEVSVKDDEKDSNDDSQKVDGSQSLSETQPDNTDTTTSNGTDVETKPEDKNYILKITGIDETNAYSEDAAISLGFKGYKYIIAVKLYAPEDFVNTVDNVNKVKLTFDKSRVDGESNVTDVTMSSNTFALLSELDSNNKTRYYIIVTMAVDGVYPGNNPYVSIDWDGDGNEHGTSRYIFDFSEFDYVEDTKDDVDSEGSETPKDPATPPIVASDGEDEDKDNTSNLDSSDQSSVVVGDGDVTDENATVEEEDETLSIENTNDNQENTDNEEDDALSEDTTPSEEIESSETTVPSVGDDGDSVSEAIQIIENNVDTI